MSEESPKPRRKPTKPKPASKTPASKRKGSSSDASAPATSLSQFLAAQKSLSESLSGIGTLPQVLAAQKYTSEAWGTKASSQFLAAQKSLSAALSGKGALSQILAGQKDASVALSGKAAAQFLAAQKSLYTLPTGQSMFATAEAAKSAARLQTEAVRSVNLASTIQFQRDAAAAGMQQPVAVPKAEEVPQSRLEAQLRKLEDDLTQNSEQLLTVEADKAGLEEENAELNRTLEKLRDQQRYAFLMTQVHPQAFKLLDESEEFRNNFISMKELSGFVVSIDIRRSTELMLKARRPDKFAYFISELCAQLAGIIVDNFGVFDKFTGDGILAFFPEFYSGEDAGYYALTAAGNCHQAFESWYRGNRQVFYSVIKETGLGIGIDYGSFSLVQVSGGLTIVGVPVVYACRLGGAPAGSTLLNQPAFEMISEKYGSSFSLDETELVLKHEGPTLAYSVHAADRPYQPTIPAWVSAGLESADQQGNSPSPAKNPPAAGAEAT